VSCVATFVTWEWTNYWSVCGVEKVPRFLCAYWARDGRLCRLQTMSDALQNCDEGSAICGTASRYENFGGAGGGAAPAVAYSLCFGVVAFVLVSVLAGGADGVWGGGRVSGLKERGGPSRVVDRENDGRAKGWWGGVNRCCEGGGWSWICLTTAGCCGRS